MDSAFKLPAFSDAFPDGLPEYSGSKPLPAWGAMNFNGFAKSLRPFSIGVYEIPVANVNMHKLQRVPSENWLEYLGTSLAKSKDADAHPGTAILNTVEVPRDSDGNPDPMRMMVTVPDGGHRSTAVGRMDWPVEEKTWVYEVLLNAVHYAPEHLMGGWITMCNRHSKLLVQTVPHTVHSVLLVAQNAYDARDLDVNKKLHSYLGTLDAKIQEAVRPLICNPMTVEKALQLFSVPLWTDYLLNYEKLQWIRSSGFTDLNLVDLFEAMYQQAGLLSNGRPAEMGLREMCPKWLPSQYQRGRVKSDCNVLATDKLQCWLKNMEDIDTKYSTLALPAANYFQGCGGTDAIERLIDSDKKIMHGDYVYAPAFFTGKAITFRRFAPFDMLLLRKQVMNGLAYLVGGWIAWNMAGNQSSPSERAAYPCPLIQSGEGVLIMYLSGYDLGENLYEYYHWWDQCKDQFQTISDAIDANAKAIADDYQKYILTPLKPISVELTSRIWTVPDSRVLPFFATLLAKSQLWWKLLSVVIGCVPGDQLPCSLILPIISPAEAAAHAAIAETNKWVSQITTKVSDAQQEKLNEIQKEKDRLAEKQKQDLEDAEVAKAKREADQKEVDEKEKARVEKSHRQQMSKQEQEAAKAMISAKAVEERVKSLKEAVAVITQKQEDGEEITDDDVRVVMGYRNDLIVGHFIDPQENSTLADIINAASQSQSSTFPPATPIVKSSKHFSRQVVDLSYSDDETDGVDLVLKSHLRQIPWKSHGLTTAIITPTVFAITKITQEDQKLLANNSHAHDVIALGIQALKERNTAIAESSGGSDTTKRSYTMGPGASLSKPNSKKKKRFEIDSDAFTASVRSSSASAKSKGKRRQVPNFSSSEEEGEQGEHESEEGNN